MTMPGPRLAPYACSRWLLLIFLALTTVVSVQAIPQRLENVTSDRLTELRAEIARHDELYFQQAKPEISDAEYDRLKQELHALEQAQPGLTPERPGFGDDRDGLFPSRTHRVRMLSLHKAYSEQEWQAFATTVKRKTGQADMTFVIEPKYDGLAISLTYARGTLIRAVTRGNGTVGDDVTANVRLIANLPTELAATGPAAPELVELRGEVFLTYAEFARINAEREAAGEEPFSHPRNLAAGTLKSHDPTETDARQLSAVVYGWGAWEGSPKPASQQAFHALVHSWGLPGVTSCRVARTVAEAWSAIQALGTGRSQLDFPTDGAVVKVDDVALQEKLGADETAPHWAVAYKFEPASAITTLRAIALQVGRTGQLTPVAEFDPVVLGGATVSRATLHNRDEILRRDIRIGDVIEVEKSGEIIPAIKGVLRERRPTGTSPYLFPERCPSCLATLAANPGSPLVRCPNSHCPAQRQRRLEHFASAQAVDISGCGPATIAALIQAGLLQVPADFYRLRREDLVRVPGIGEKKAERLLAAIAQSKEAELWRFICGLGIGQVGPAAAKQLAGRCGYLETLLQLKAPDLADTLGSAAATSVAEFLGAEENRQDIRSLLIAGIYPTPPASPTPVR